MKWIIWAFAICVLLLGWREAHSDLWGLLAIFLVIDIPCTFALLSDVVKDGREHRSLSDDLRDESNSLMGAAFRTIVYDTVGLSDRWADGVEASFDSKEAPEYSITFRIIANLIWSVILAWLSLLGLWNWC